MFSSGLTLALNKELSQSNLAQFYIVPLSQQQYLSYLLFMLQILYNANFRPEQGNLSPILMSGSHVYVKRLTVRAHSKF